MDEIIKVQFHCPLPDKSGQEYYFTSLAAIYEQFTPADIGIGLTSLWGYGLRVGHPKVTKTCVISKHYIHRKPQTNKRKSN